MKFKKKTAAKAAAVSLAAVFACGMLAGCDLVTTNSERDMAQVIAEVDISEGEDFASGGEYAAYADVIRPASILKRDLVSGFLSYGYQYVQSYGYTYEAAFNQVKNNLVNHDLMLQYAIVEFLEAGSYEGMTYSADAYKKLCEAEYEDDNARAIATVGYFLTDEEKAEAEYAIKVSLNNSLDAQEESIIRSEEELTGVTVRTVPTGVGTENEDYYDPAYRVYTGKNAAAQCGSYETVENSTPSTRLKAYNTFLSSLIANGLLEKGEDVSEFETLSYYQLQLAAAYEDALLAKLTEYYEARAEEALTQDYVTNKYETTLESQKQEFSDSTALEEALDAVSDTSFVLTAPEETYGFVINILLPFSTTQSSLLTNYKTTAKEGDAFVYRAELLANVKATDQRETWFTGDTDYSYTRDDGKYYFFEDNLSAGENSKYEPLKNYVGDYAYNGSVSYDEEKKTYTLKPNKISVEEFVDTFESYLEAQGLTVNRGSYTQDYFSQSADSFYKADGTVDYSKFLYYTGSVQLDGYSANDTFVAGTDVNKAMSAVNELSFAYNTDTAGLNSYLGYAVSAYDTSFVKEFEYAAKAAIAGGVGTYTVAPSDYGWHIMYCTFTYQGNDPYTFDFSDIGREGSFSNLYYEALKDATVDGYATEVQTRITNSYSACVTVYEDRYEDLYLEADAAASSQQS